MSQKAVTVENMTKEQHRSLDKKANIALIVSLIVFLIVAGGLYFKYSKMREQSSSGGGSASSSSFSNDSNLAGHVDMGKGIDQKKLDEMLRKGDFDIAGKKLKEILKKDENNFMANMQLGQLYFYTGKMDKSIKHLTKAQEMNPGDIFCLQILGQVYIISDPKKAVAFFEKNLPFQMDRKDLSVSAVRAYHTASVKSAKNKKEKTAYLEKASKLLKQCDDSTDKHIPRSYIDLLCGENAFLKGNYERAKQRYSQLPISQKNIGNMMEKINATTALGEIYLIKGNHSSAYGNLEKAFSLQENWKELKAEKTIPRGEELAVVIHTLFEKPGLYDRLEKMKSHNESIYNNADIKPIGNSKELRNLIYKMVKNEKDNKLNEALKNGSEILKNLKNQKGYFYDVGILNPLFRGSLLIYMGDISLKSGDAESAVKYYKQASGDATLKKIALKRISQAK